MSFPNSHSCTVAVIGLGYVGLPLSLAFASSGLKVIGFDIDKGKVNSINSGKSYFHHIKDKITTIILQNY